MAEPDKLPGLASTRKIPNLRYKGCLLAISDGDQSTRICLPYMNKSSPGYMLVSECCSKASQDNWRLQKIKVPKPNPRFMIFEVLGQGFCLFLQVSVVPGAPTGRRMGERLHRRVPMVEIIGSLVRIIHGLIVFKSLMRITVSSGWHIVVRVWEVTIHWLKETKAQSASISPRNMEDGDKNKYHFIASNYQINTPVSIYSRNLTWL